MAAFRPEGGRLSLTVQFGLVRESVLGCPVTDVGPWRSPETYRLWIDALHAAVVAALNDPAIVKKLDDLGFLPGGEPPAQFAESAKKEAAIWEATVAKGKLAVD